MKFNRYLDINPPLLFRVTQQGNSGAKTRIGCGDCNAIGILGEDSFQLMNNRGSLPDS